MKTMKQILALLSAAAAAVMLAACGSGAGGVGAGTGGTTTGSGLTITVQTVGLNSVATNTVAAGDTVRAYAVFKSSNGSPVANAIVTFTVSGSGVATLSPSSGTALTNASGVAYIDVIASAPNVGGAISVGASAAVGGTTTTASAWNLYVPASSTVNNSTAPAINLDVLGTTSTHTMQAGGSVTVKVTVTSSTGAAIPNQLVTIALSSDAALVVMAPASGNVLTDASGAATAVLTAKVPSVGGTFQVIATATVAGSTLSTQPWGVNVGQASITLGTASLVAGTPNPLPSGSTASIKVPVTSAGVAVTAAAISDFNVTSGCASLATAKASIEVIGVSNGVLSINYKNLGCSLGADTVNISMLGAVNAASISIPVSSAPVSELRYIGAQPGSALVVKGAGGFGKQESGVVTFKLVDTTGNGVAGATVQFKESTIAGGIKLSAYSGITDSNGLVSITLYAGTLPTPVTILATTQDPVTLASLSSASSLLSISAGPPEQRSMSLSVETFNILGDLTDGTTTNVTVRMSDYWGNSVSDGTVVSMIAEGGNISNAANGSGSCATVNGACSMVFTTQNFRPTDRRVSIVAYAAGVEGFTDANGNGVFDAGESCFHNGAPFVNNDESVDSSGNPSWNGTETLITNIAPSSNTAKTPAACAVRNPTYVSAHQVIVMSGVAASAAAVHTQTFANNGCTPIAASFLIKDRNGNRVPAGSTVSISDADLVTAGTVYSGVVGNSSAYGSVHQVVLKPDSASCALAIKPIATFLVVVTTGSVAIAFPFSIQY